MGKETAGPGEEHGQREEDERITERVAANLMVGKKGSEGVGEPVLCAVREE